MNSFLVSAVSNFYKKGEMKTILTAILILFSLILSSCKKNPVAPHSNSTDTTSHNFNFKPGVLVNTAAVLYTMWLS